MFLVSPDLVVGGVVGDVAGVVAGVDEGEVGSGGVVGIVEEGVPVGTAEDVVVPSAAGVVGGSGFLKGSTQVCRT